MTGIQWTDETDNIIVVVDESGNRHGWWCRKVSPGCAHCYSEDINDSDYFHGNHLKYEGQPPVLKLREDIIDKWQRQTKPRKHFVMSMSDVFGEWVPQSWIFRMLDGMRAAPRQTFQVLTKRADVMLREVTAWLKSRELSRVPSNIWLGFSVENQHFANERIPLLLQIPCDVRFLSVEPLLGDVDLSPWLDAFGPENGALPCDECGSLDECDHDLGPAIVAWVIVGGESGADARPTFVERVRKIVRDCVRFGIALFTKQLGDNVIDRNDVGFEGEDPTQWPTSVADLVEHDPNGHREEYQGAPVRIHLKKKGGEPHMWPAELRIRQFPEVPQGDVGGHIAMRDCGCFAGWISSDSPQDIRKDFIASWKKNNLTVRECSREESLTIPSHCAEHAAQQSEVANV